MFNILLTQVTSQLLQLGSRLRSSMAFLLANPVDQTTCYMVELKLFFKVWKSIHFILKILPIIVLINILELRFFFLCYHMSDFQSKKIVIWGSSQSLHREYVVGNFCHWNLPLKKKFNIINPSNSSTITLAFTFS